MRTNLSREDRNRITQAKKPIEAVGVEVQSSWLITATPYGRSTNTKRIDRQDPPELALRLAEGG